ncbi:MAG TPA: formyltransferase family protein [Azospirillaceae bacterium]|nr:formyltransferase family protein [Azospirillaceae bacterium]
MRDPTVMLAAEESAGLKLMRALAGTGCRVAGVLATPEGPAWTLARTLGHRVWPAQMVRDPAFADTMRREGVDALLNVHSLHIMCGPVLAAPPLGAFNLHPGPLPEYAGLDPPSWALYHGESHHGVTLHAMTGRVDDGGIVERADFAIGPEDTALTLYARCVTLGLPMVLRLIATLATGARSPTLQPMDPARRRYFGRRVPEEGRLSWERPAAAIVNFVRACDYHPFASPWGHPKTRLDGCEMAIAKARLSAEATDAPPGMVVALDETGARVACGDALVLVSHLALDGRLMRPAAVLRAGQVLS